MQEQAIFLEAMEGYLSADNTLRGNSVQYLDKLRNDNVDAFCLTLFQVIQLENVSPTLIELGLVLIRSAMEKHTIAPTTIISFKDSIFVLIKNSPLFIFTKVADLAAAIAAHVVDHESSWEALTSYVKEECSSEEQVLKKLIVLRCCLFYQSVVLSLQQVLEDISRLVILALESPATNIFAEGVSCLCNILYGVVSLEHVVAQFRSHCELALKKAITTDSLQSLQALADVCATVRCFQSSPMVIESLLQTIVTNSNLSIAMRDSCASLIISLFHLIEAKKTTKEERNLKKSQPFIQKFIQGASNLIALYPVEDPAVVEEWLEETDNEAEEDANVRTIGVRLLNSGLEFFDASSMSAGILMQVRENLRERREHASSVLAALELVSLLSQVHPKKVLANIKEIIDTSLFYLSHPSPIIRFTAISLIQNLLDEPSEDFVNTHVEAFIPPLGKMGMGDSATRVRVHAFTALSMLFASLEKERDGEKFNKYISPLVGDCISPVLQDSVNNPPLVRELAVALLAVIAEFAGELFAPFFRQSMDLVYQILDTSSKEDLKGFVQVAVELSSAVCVAVGKDVVRADANKMMGKLHEILLHAEQDQRSSLGETFHASLLSAFSTLANCLGGEFNVYLDIILPSLMQGASKEVSINISSQQRDTTGRRTTLKEENGVSVLSFATSNSSCEQVQINVGAVEEKKNFIFAIGEIARSVGDGFAPYAERVIQALLPSLVSDFSSVRANALEAIAAVLSTESPKFQLEFLFARGEEGYLGDVVEMVAKNNIKNIGSFGTPSLRSYCELAQRAFEKAAARGEIPSVLCETERMKRIAEKIYRFLGEVAAKALETLKECEWGEDEEEEDEEEKEEKEEELTIIDDSMQISGALVKIFGQEACECFDRNLKKIFLLCMGLDTEINQTTDVSQVRGCHSDAEVAGLCAFADMIHFTGRAQYANTLLPLVKKYIVLPSDLDDDEMLGLTQSSLYALGCMALKTPQVLAGWENEAIKRIFIVLESSLKDDEDRRVLIDVAIGAAMRVAIGLNSVTGDSTSRMIVRTLITKYLPISEDEDEGRRVHDLFLHVLEQQTFINVASHDKDLLPKIKIVCEKIYENPDLLSEATLVTKRLENVCAFILKFC